MIRGSIGYNSNLSGSIAYDTKKIRSCLTHLAFWSSSNKYTLFYQKVHIYITAKNKNQNRNNIKYGLPSRNLQSVKENVHTHTHTHTNVKEYKIIIN